MAGSVVRGVRQEDDRLELSTKILGRLIRLSVLLYGRVQVYGLGEFWLNEKEGYAWVGFRWRPGVPTSGGLLRLLEQSRLSVRWLDQTVHALRQRHRDTLWFSMPFLGTFGVVNGEWFLLEPEEFPLPAWGGTLLSLPSTGIGQPLLPGQGETVLSDRRKHVRRGRSLLIAGLVGLVFLGFAGLVVQLWWWTGGDWQNAWNQWKTILYPGTHEPSPSGILPPDTVLQQVQELLHRYGYDENTQSAGQQDSASQLVSSGDTDSVLSQTSPPSLEKQVVDSIQYLPGYYVVVASGRHQAALRIPQKLALWLTRESAKTKDSSLLFSLKLLRRRGVERVRLAIGPMDRRAAQALADSLRRSGRVPDAWVLYWRDSVEIWAGVMRADSGKR